MEERVTPKFVKPAESLTCTNNRTLLVAEALWRMLFSHCKCSSAQW